ncbi:acetamidase/formamidase family protein [Neorhizobium sp. JUb45]|uniref:acetamidase/formamidase family protein n=1 Tax=Neorhizobium sp. JUb45 TaxID=2485113 RepID=UPI00104582E3|nr:acetamidase/formamidase family protein [Neorhizobium sp. JUb45]TCQ97270.1 acetamidase/formamidase [Neorhizobium sp. JUb45]
MPHHDVFPSPETVHWGSLDASLKPVVEIGSGDTVTIHSVSGSPAEVSRDPAHVVRPELSAIHQALSPSPGPHILTGPVYIRGAEPGDTLRVEIVDIQLRDDWGFNIIRPGKGALPDDFTDDHMMHLTIDRQARTITTPWGMVLPARPFFGIMATAPRPQDGRLTSIVPGYFGGNMDNRHLGAGAVLYLPVSVEGALFSAGDGHASQGDGEVCLTAVETGLSGTFRIDVIKGATLSVPYAETPDHLITMGFDEDLERAMQSALRAAIRMIVDRTGLTEPQAYSLCSMATDASITQVVNIKKGAHVMIPKAVINQSNRKA